MTPGFSLAEAVLLHCGKYRLSLARPLVMGIVNLTPDSFSGDGLGAAPEAAALAHAALGTVMAAHLSARNNTPELARQALSAALGRTPEDIPVADPRHGSAWWAV